MSKIKDQVLTTRDSYYELLKKFSINEDLYNLIEECIIDDNREQEINYLQFGGYRPRNLLMKLKTDLITVKEATK